MVGRANRAGTGCRRASLAASAGTGRCGVELNIATPLAAWGFASLLVPILIHFFANRWQQPIRFAALRFLQPAAEQGRARRLSDLLLLLLRLLLLAVMVLALMAPS